MSWRGLSLTGAIAETRGIFGGLNPSSVSYSKLHEILTLPELVSLYRTVVIPCANSALDDLRLQLFCFDLFRHCIYTTGTEASLSQIHIGHGQMHNRLGHGYGLYKLSIV